MDMDRYSAPLRVVLNIATLKAYVTHNWAKSEFDLMQMPWRNLGSSEIGFCASPACTPYESARRPLSYQAKPVVWGPELDEQALIEISLNFA